jgi:hypothetical protein
MSFRSSPARGDCSWICRNVIENVTKTVSAFPVSRRISLWGLDRRSLRLALVLLNCIRYEDGENDGLCLKYVATCTIASGRHCSPSSNIETDS